MVRRFILGSIILFFSVVFYFFTFKDNRSSFSTVISPSPTPFLFQEMTIGYLRKRTYTSRLGEFVKYSENSDYTSYRTHYDSDGLKIYGLLTIPKKDAQSYPAIVFVHGYIAPSIYTTTQNYIAYVDYLAKNGFVVFKIDLRGHDQSEGVASGAYYSSDYVIDTLNARAALASSGFVQKDRIGLWGHSMAGNVVMRSFAVAPEIPAVVIWAGAGYTYEDLALYRISDMSYRPPSANTERQKTRQLLRDTYGEFDKNHPFWRQIAVTDYLHELQGAVQIHHAVDDEVVSIQYSRNLIKLLDATTVSHEFFEYESGGHNITGMYFEKAMQKTVEFFKKYLESGVVREDLSS